MKEGAGLRRDLGWVHSTGIVVGAIIGVGIFLTPSKVAAVAGSPWAALGLWILGGAIALAGALAMAEVGARFPTSGGQIVALHRMLGPLPAFLYGWCLLTAIQTGVLVIITLFGAQNLAVALGVTWDDTAVSAVASAFILMLAAINLAGVRQGAAVQTSTSLVKLLILAALALLGLWVVVSGDAPTAIETAAQRPASEVPWIAALAFVLFSYGGFHQLTWVGGEVRDPQRTLPRAIIAGILTVIVAYLAANLAYSALLPYEALASSSTLAADAMGGLFPQWGRRLTAAALCISAYGIANASLLTAPRVYYALAKEKLFPSAFATLAPGSGVPRAAILLQSSLALLLLWLAGQQRMDQLVNGVVFVDWSFHALACVGLLKVWRAGGSDAPSYQAPGRPWPAVLFIAGTVTALSASFLDPAVRQSSLLGLIWAGVGVVLYAILLRRSGSPMGSSDVA